jgi:hypothetical protein
LIKTFRPSQGEDSIFQKQKYRVKYRKIVVHGISWILYENVQEFSASEKRLKSETVLEYSSLMISLQTTQPHHGLAAR